MTRVVLAPGWLAGAVPGGIVCVRGTREVDVGFAAPEAIARRLVAALASGCDAAGVARLADTTAGESQELLDRLIASGALVCGGPAAAEHEASLAAAIRSTLAGDPVERAWTADELLALPSGISAETARRAVRAFVSGLRPGARLAAYAELAAGGGAVAGDIPDGVASARALDVVAALDPAAIHVVPLVGGPVVSVTPDALDVLGFDAPHRLGPLVALRPTAPAADGRATAGAIHVPASLRHPRPERDRWAHGSGEDARTAALLARAEAAERFAMGDPTAVRLERGRPGDLGDHVLPGMLHRWSARQLADHADRRGDADGDERLWAPARTPEGRVRWVPAEAVLLPFDDPYAPRGLEQTSSGVAAHTGAGAAAEHAVLELIERDAFVWTWVQRVSRERIDAASLPSATAALHAALTRSGRRVDLVNLTLDTCPVVLVVAQDDRGLTATAASHPDAARAAARALGEAAMLAASLPDAPPVAIDDMDVCTPDDHLNRHRDPRAIADAGFLTGGSDVIDVREVVCVPGPALEAVRVAGEPLTVLLTSPATRPFDVVRALVPGLVPLSFGWDREPLGMPRLAGPVTLGNGRVLGRELDLEHRAPIAPHPFA